MIPTVRIYRGLPGSGKDYHCTGTLTTDQGVKLYEMFSADLFWGPKYEFDPKRIGEAHAWCYFSYLQFLHAYKEMFDYLDKVHINYLVVNNTNIRAYEIAPYVQAANAYELTHEIITLVCDPKVACERNIHKVPANVIFSMYQGLLEERLPPFWNHTVMYV